ncbi:retrovirus-related pol polyprotein from transposon TNT 1-94 [Tanacetum coccineum]
MTGNRKLFSSYKAYNGGNVIFGSNLRGNIIGKGQICDNKCRVTFSEHDSEITKDGKVIGRGIRKKGLYVMKLGNKPKDQICLATIDENSTLWHRRLGHANMRLIQSLASKELVRNLPKLKFDQHFCDACKIGKQAHTSHKAKNIVSTTRCLELLHMDLFGPSAVWSYRGNRYTLVIVDDYSSFARFNTIITSLKALDEGFSRKNYVRKFLRALHPKWRAKVTAIEESKDLSSLALDELIGNLKVHELVMEKDSEIYRGEKERIKSIALKAKKESSDDETLTSGNDDEEYAMAKAPKGAFVSAFRVPKGMFGFMFYNTNCFATSRALHPKWRAKVTAIEESKDLSSLALDELIGNPKVHKIVMEKDSEIYRGRKERVNSIALKAKTESSDGETLISGSDDEEYAMAKGKSDRKCFRCGDPNHLIGDCPKPSRNKDQKALIRGSWSDNENDAKDKTYDKTCLMAQSSNEVCLRTCLEQDKWIKDSGCSKHMTGNKSLFSTYKAYDGARRYGVSVPTLHKKPQRHKDEYTVTMDDPNITMAEYIRLEEEKARRRGKVYNWETAMYAKICLTSNETPSYEPTVSSLNDEIDFRISFDESDEEDYTEINNRIACRNFFQENECEIFIVSGDGVRIFPDGVKSPDL